MRISDWSSDVCSSDLPGGEAALDDGNALLHAVDTDPRGIHRDARLVVVAAHPAGAEAHLDPAAGEHVDRSQLLGEDDRVLVVVVEAEGPDLQLGGGVRRGKQRRARGRMVTEGLGEAQGGVHDEIGMRLSWGREGELGYVLRGPG